jgi:hypothetical protein
MAEKTFLTNLLAFKKNSEDTVLYLWHLKKDEKINNRAQ